MSLAEIDWYLRGTKHLLKRDEIFNPQDPTDLATWEMTIGCAYI